MAIERRPGAVPALEARPRRLRAAVALFATSITLFATACSSGGEQGQSEDALYKNPVTLTWWHNASQEGPGKVFWQKVADDFHAAHPTVTVKIEAIETNQLQRTRIPAALLSGQPPDIFQAWGGGEIVEQVGAGYLKDITEQTKTEVANIGGAAGIWQVTGDHRRDAHRRAGCCLWVEIGHGAGERIR